MEMNNYSITSTRYYAHQLVWQIRDLKDKIEKLKYNNESIETTKFFLFVKIQNLKWARRAK